MKQNGEPETNPYIYGQLIYNKWVKNIGERIVPSMNGAEKTWKPHAKKWNWSTILHHTRNQLRMDKILECKNWKHKLLEENIGENLLDISLANDCLDLTPKEKATKAKTNKWTASN